MANNSKEEECSADRENLFLDLFETVDHGNVPELKKMMTEDKYKNLLDFQIVTELTNNLGEVYKDGETILHIAADKSDVESVTVLLEAGADRTKKDNKGRIPLHLVLDGGCRCKKCTKRNEDCVKVLIKKDVEPSQVNEEDNDNRTPLYYSASHMMPNCASILLENGADINHKTNKNPDGFLLVQKIPEVMVGELDKGVKFHDKDSSKLQLDFRVILQWDPEEANMLQSENAPKNDIEKTKSFPRNKEMELLDCMLRAHKAGREVLLTHPLTEAFLYLKWTAVGKWFWIIRLLYYLFAILYTVYIFNVFLVNCSYPDIPEDAPEDENDASSTFKHVKIETKDDGEIIICESTPAMIAMSSMMSVGIVFMIFNELYEISQDKDYFRIGLNYAWWLLFATIAITLFPGFGMDARDWQYPIAAFAVFYVWGMTLVQVGRIPQVGVYVEMLGKVLKDFAMFFATYFALLIGFALGFCVLFPQNEMFQKEYAALAFVKVLLIMIGDSDYEGLLTDESPEYEFRSKALEYSILAHIIFVGFIIIITIVLMNLLLGLAVSDIQELQKKAALVRVTSAKNYYSDENQNVYPNDFTSLFEFCPTDPIDKYLPEDIKQKFIPYLTSSPCLNYDRYKQPKKQLRKIVNLTSKVRAFGINSIKSGFANALSQKPSSTTAQFVKADNVDSSQSAELPPQFQQQMELLLRPLHTAIAELHKKVEDINVKLNEPS